MYGTWNLFLEEIKRRASGQSSSENAQAAKAAIMILQICAFFHHSNISRDIFQSAAEKSRKKNIKSKVAKKLLLASTYWIILCFHWMMMVIGMILFLDKELVSFCTFP